MQPGMPGTRTSQPAPNVLIQQSPLPPSSSQQSHGYPPPQMMAASYAGTTGPPRPPPSYAPQARQRPPFPPPQSQHGGLQTSSPILPPNVAPSPVFASASPATQPPHPQQQPPHPQQQQQPPNPSLPVNAGPGGQADSNASTQLSALLASTNWTVDFWEKQAAEERSGLASPPGLERLDSHSPLSLARLGNARVNHMAGKVLELCTALLKPPLDLQPTLTLFKTEQINQKTRHLLDLRRLLDSVSALLAKLVNVQQLLNERRPAASPNATQQYLAQIEAWARDGPIKQEPLEQNLSPSHRQLKLEREAKLKEMAAKDALLQQTTEQLRWLYWEIGALSHPL